MNAAPPAGIRNRHGERIDFSFEPGSDDHVVVIGHGVTSHKERPWLIALSDGLRAAGIASLRFSFSGNGRSEGRFEDSTISKEVEDLGSVLDALEGWHIAYAGHSMGGAVGLLRTIADARIEAFVSLAGIVHVSKFMDFHFGHQTPGRDVMLGKPHCPLTESFLADAHALDTLVHRGNEVRVPWLIVHGTDDEIVPLEDSLDIVAATDDPPELVQLAGVDHRYSRHEHEMTAVVVPWLARWTGS